MGKGRVAGNKPVKGVEKGGVNSKLAPPPRTVQTPTASQSRGGISQSSGDRGLMPDTPTVDARPGNYPYQPGISSASDMDMYAKTRSPFIQATDKLHLDQRGGYTDIGQGRQAFHSAYDRTGFQNLSGMEQISRNQEERMESQYNRIQDANWRRDSAASRQQFQQGLAMQQDQGKQQMRALDKTGYDAALAQDKQIQGDAYSQIRSINANETGMVRNLDFQQREGNANRGVQRLELAMRANDSQANRDLQRGENAADRDLARRGQDLQFAASRYANDSAKYQAFLGASQATPYWRF